MKIKKLGSFEREKEARAWSKIFKGSFVVKVPGDKRSRDVLEFEKKAHFLVISTNKNEKSGETLNIKM